MAHLKEAARRGTRHPLWSKELFKEELENGAGGSIRSICIKWSSDPNRIQGLTNDVARWRKEDPEIDALCHERFDLTHENGGRPSLEKEEPDWRRLFCEEYIKTKSRVAAAKVTPYDYESIRRKLELNKTEYDPVFADMLAAAEAKLLDRAEQIVHESLELEPSHRNKAWIALQLLRVRDRARYGDRIDVSVGGSVRHVLDGQKIIAQLAETQERFFDKNKKMLEANSVVDAEVVQDETKE